MPKQRAYDETTERRRLKPSADDRHGFVRWLDNLFFVGAEVCFLGSFGVLAVTLIAAWPGTLELAMALVLLVTTGFGATIRGGWIDVGRPWPETTVRSVLARAGWYSLVVFVGAFGGAWAGGTVGSGVVTAGWAAGVSALGAVGVPWLTNR